MSQALTVLQVIPRLDAGGAEQTCVEIAQGLVQAGHRALVAGGPGRLVQPLRDVGGIFIGFDGATKNPLKIIANGRWMARLAAREHVDIIHARSRAPAWSARLAARHARCAFVTTYHGIYSEGSKLKRVYNSVMASGDRVIANSHFTAETIKSRYGTLPDRLTTIYRGMDPEAFDPKQISADDIAAMRGDWGVQEGQRVVLLPARFTALKGQSDLLEAVALLQKNSGLSVVVVLAGTGSTNAYARQLGARAQELGLAGGIRFCEHIDTMPVAYRAADVVVMATTRAESFGRTVVEAQAMGRPIVATGLGPIPETVLAPPRVDPARRTGWIVPPGDAPAMAGALEAALGLNFGQRQDLAKRARAHVLENFTTAAMVAATLAVYQDLAGLTDARHERP
ncbi:MAG: glycosyltransferase family 4 protein [Alphaproteobacteria bacterium]